MSIIEPALLLLLTVVVAVLGFVVSYFLRIGNTTDWSSLTENLAKHRNEVAVATAQYKAEMPSGAFELAIVDVISEKAVEHLSLRSAAYYKSAWVLLVMTLLTLALALAWFEHHRIDDLLSQFHSDKFSANQLLIIFLVRSAAIGALLAAAPGVLGSLAFSYFHEATAAYQQRNTIRFGRLWLSLQLSGEHPTKPTLANFREAFGLNQHYNTAFRRMKMPKSLSSEASDTLKSLLETLRNDPPKTTEG